MQVERLYIDGLCLLTPRRFGDDRGWLSETWNRRRMAEAGLEIDFCQDNQSFSRAAGTLRGLHYQRAPRPQAKLVRCLAGRIFDVAVDARPGSPGFGRWRGVTLTPEDGAQFLIPHGFLHGFLTLAPDTHVAYKVDNFYNPDLDAAVAWDDPDLAIDWPLAEAGVTQPVLSDKDAAAPRLADADLAMGVQR